MKPYKAHVYGHVQKNGKQGALKYWKNQFDWPITPAFGAPYAIWATHTCMGQNF